MKKILSIIAAITFTTFANAQKVYEPGEEGNDTQLGIFIDADIEEISSIPVSIYLNDPQQNINSFQLYLQLPDNATWNYDEEEEDYVYEKSSRNYSGHTVTSGMSESDKRQGQFFVSISDSRQRNFKQTEGTLVTFYFDGSKLTDVQYEIKLIEPLASDGSNKYLSKDDSYAFSVANGTVTGINGISADAQNAKYYSVNGAIQNGPQKGVNIVKYANGEVKKVIVK